MDRIIVDVRTGEQSVVPLTPAEEADAAARTAAEIAENAPRQAEREAIQQLQAATKADAMFKALEKADAAQIANWIDTNFAGMTAQQRALLKMLTQVAAMVLKERG